MAARPAPPAKKPTAKESLLSWVKTIAAALVLALLIKNFLVVNASVVSGSMENTIMTGDRVICNRLAYLGDGPQRFDVVAFNFEEGDTTSIYVKRVIGLPGEMVTILDGKVYIGDSADPLPDSFTRERPVGDYGPFQVPEGEYFMLGDNRNSSYDSKSWPYPFVPKKDILGKALFSYYPTIKGIAGVEE